MTTIDDAMTTGLTTRSGSAVWPFDWSCAPVTALAPAMSWWGWTFGPVPKELQTVEPRRVLSIKVEDGDLQMVRLAAGVERRLNELLAMRAGWDLGQGAELAEDAVTAAVPMMFGILREQLVAPQVFPLSDGGLQFEWHISGNSIEVEVEPDGSAFATAEVRDEGVMLEEDVDDSTVARLREFLVRFLTAA